MRTIVLIFALYLIFPAWGWAQSFDARLDWARRVEMSLEESGRIAEVSVQAGDRVQAGAVLLRLDSTPFESAVIRAKARVSRTKAELAEAKRDLERARELYDRGVLATVPLQQAELAVTRAESESTSAEAELRHAQYRLTGSQVVAPFDAWVIHNHAVVGQSVAVRLQPPVLMVLGEAGKYLARALVAPDTAFALKKGAAATVQFAGQAIPGTVESIALEPDEQNRYEVEVVFSSSARPRIGAAAKLEFR